MYLEFVTKSHSPGFIILSFAVCIIGSWTTLELIHRRTAVNGWHNWGLLLGCSLSMGGMAVWCTHFIGNFAVILGEGGEMQAAYSPGMTALACLLPIIITSITFLVVASENTFSYIRVGLGGTLAGLGFCGAYYAGQTHISNYNCYHDLAFVVAAALLAVITNILALGIYSWFRSTWSADWWLRGICSFLLAGAVSGMFWLSSSGTLYQMKKEVGPNLGTRIATTISVLVLSIFGCLVLIFTAIIKNATRLRTKRRAHQVVLATAVFDCNGRLMVTPEGVLPNRKITGSYLEQDMNDTFNNSHSNFQWMMRASYDWKTVKELIPAMRKHLVATGLKSRFGAESNFLNEEGIPIKDYHLVFRELFCTAAADLAEDLRQPLVSLGIMFDDIISTDQKPKQNRFIAEKRTSSVDLERDDIEMEAIGNGQLLFLIRKVDQEEADRLQSAGFRFADIMYLIPILGGVFRIRRADLQARLDEMYQCSTANNTLDRGVHFGLFCVRASVEAGFEILAQKSGRNLLPTMQMPADTLDEWQAKYLGGLDGETVSSCLRQFDMTANVESLPAIEKLFASQLYSSLEELRDEIGDSFFDDARLIGVPVEVPCGVIRENYPSSKAVVFVFRIVMPLEAQVASKKLCYVPLTLFKTRQHTLKNAPDHVAFARRTYHEFAAILDLEPKPYTIDFLTPPLRIESTPYSSILGTLPPAVLNLKQMVLKKLRLGSRSEYLDQDIGGTVSSEYSKQFGGIAVMNEVHVDILHRKAFYQPENVNLELNADGRHLHAHRDTEGMIPKNTSVVPQAYNEEGPEYVDELLRLSMALR